MKKFSTFLANLIFVLSCWYGYLKHKFTTNKVFWIQKKKLFLILKKNKECDYGKKYQFKSIKTIEEFQSQVPLTTFESYAREIDLICQGKDNVLTSNKIEIFEPTSGSTSASKLIPYTKKLHKEFQAGIKPWIFNLYTNKKILFTKSYWSISPTVDYNGNSCRVPIGFENDTQYLGFLGKIVFRHILVVPDVVSKIKDIDTFQYVTLLFLLKEKNLGFISIWNPTFLILMIEKLIIWHGSLIDDISNGTISGQFNLKDNLKKEIIKKISPNKRRAKELSAIFNSSKKTMFKEIWPNLKLISCWGDGNAKHYLNELLNFFPHVEIQKKGIIATEGFISFPKSNKKGSVLSVNSHFFEFIEINSNDIKLAHQLERGKRYSVAITTSGGLYRYQLQDMIEVIGFEKQCPKIIFIGKEDNVSDLFGEKLNENHLTQEIERVFSKYSLFPEFFMVAPEKDGNNNYFYCLFLQAGEDIQSEILRKISREFERALRNNFHYNYCRKLGQLEESKLFIISNNNTQSVYMDACRSFGQRYGNIKPKLLHKKIGWSRIFEGDFIA